MRDSFVLYCSLREPLKKLSENETGSLFKAILDYVAEGTEPNGLSQAAEMAFMFVKSQLDRDSEKYDAVCQKRAEAGRLGGLQKQANLANATKRMQNIASVGDTYNDTKNDSVSESKKKYSADFVTFWNAYPRKVDKGQAYRKYRERLKDGFSPDELIRAAESYRGECERLHTDPQYIKHAKTFLGESLPFCEYPNSEAPPKCAPIPDGVNPFR